MRICKCALTLLLFFGMALYVLPTYGASGINEEIVGECDPAYEPVVGDCLNPIAADPVYTTKPMHLNKAEVEAIARKYAAKYGIIKQVKNICKVINAESRGFTAAAGHKGRYVGMCQFMPRTFRAYVKKMVDAGVLDIRKSYSPMNPDDAVNVMVWMWSEKEYAQWGPARKIRREILIAFK